MKAVPYASALGSLMYGMLCTKPVIYYEINMVNRYQSNSELEHRTEVRNIFKYLRRTRDYMLVYEVNQTLTREIVVQQNDKPIQ